MSLKKFLDEYARQMEKAVLEHPDEYGYSLSAVPAVVARIASALDRGSYSKDGRAIKNTCKALGIPHTYQAINAYLRGIT